MASSRRKQDDKHLKILREFVSKQENRTCFDCHQKGPTYVNMTIGSFICTSCSGILRGLNPPHRVKSISMASFTAEEVEQIKLKGNQYCQSVWLGLFDGKSNLFPDKKDEHKIRDFMISKYERKRFYVDPSIAFKNGNISQPKSETSSSASTPGSENRMLGSTTTTNSATSVSRPVASVQNSGSSPSLNGLHQSNSLKLSSSVDLLSRLASNSPPKIQQQAPDKDLFRSPPVSQPPSEGFANFENANIFSIDDYSMTHSNSPPLPCFQSPPLSILKLPPDPDLTTNSDSPSLCSSPEYEEELSAAMPLIPTGELPPTWREPNPEEKGSGNAPMPLLFPSGLSAQYVAPSVSHSPGRQSRPSSRQESGHAFREVRSSSLPMDLFNSGATKVQPEPPSKNLARLASWTSSSLSNLLPSRSRFNSKSKQRDDRKYWDEAVSKRDLEDPEDELSPAMPLLSLDPTKIECNPCEDPVSGKFCRQFSTPLGLPFDHASALKKTASSSNLNCKPESIVQPPILRKVSSSHNLTTEDGFLRRDDHNRPMPRQLSAIPNRVRARIMSEEDLQMPKNRLSSSFSDSGPLAKRLSFDAGDVSLGLETKPLAAEDSDIVPVTNKVSLFTNPPFEVCSFEMSETVDDRSPSCTSLCSNNSTCINPFSISWKPTHGWMLWDSPVMINPSDSSDRCVIETKARHASLPSLTNLDGGQGGVLPGDHLPVPQMPFATSQCSISASDLTCLASRSVTGASISKPSSNPPCLPFSSNFFTPLSSSSSSTTTPKPVSTSAPSNLTASAASLAVSEDRYAALKDLDEAFKVQKEVDKPSGNNSVIFGSPAAGTSQQPQSGNPPFGTPPMNSSGGGFYPNSSQGWNATFPPPVNPFSGSSSSNGNMGSGWPNSSNFASLSTQAQPQVNPFAGGADPNFNSQFIPGFGPAPSNHNVSHFPAFGSSPNLPNGSTNPWGSHSPPNPFSAPPPVVPSGGSSYNPFL